MVAPVIVESRLAFGDFDGARTSARAEAGAIAPVAYGPAWAAPDAQDAPRVAVAPRGPRASIPHHVALAPPAHHDKRPAAAVTPRAAPAPVTPRAAPRHSVERTNRAPAAAPAPAAPPTPPAAPTIGAYDFARHSTMGLAKGAPATQRPSRGEEAAQAEAAASARRRAFAAHIRAGGQLGEPMRATAPAAKPAGGATTPAAASSGATPDARPAPPRMPVNPRFTRENAQALRETAAKIGADPHDLATVMAYETIGSFSPSRRGGAGNRYVGLIQFGPQERARYGAHEGQTFREQLPAVAAYLKDRGFRPGMGLADLYSTVLAGRPGLYRRRDQNGSVEQHVRRMLIERREQARQFLESAASSGGASPAASAGAPTPPAPAAPVTTAGR